MAFAAYRIHIFRTIDVLERVHHCVPFLLIMKGEINYGSALSHLHTGTKTVNLSFNVRTRRLKKRTVPKALAL